ncbi:MAG: permease-like cell division protein FtsX [bacterium]|nr:permease-like cell division protein FtsX [bacterium]
MANILLIGHGIKHGIINVFKNRRFSLASIGTIAACLFLFGVFYFVLMNLQYNVDKAQENVGFTVLFKEGTGEERIHEIQDQIVEKLDTANVVYTSAEDAWKNFKSELSEDLVKTFGNDNPLKDSASLTVTLKDVTKQNEAVGYIEKIEGVRKVKRSEEVADVFGTFNNFIGVISGAIIVLLLGISIFLISTTVSMGITVRREEISIMRLIGASDFFIRGPFIFEGMFLGLIGAAIPLGILYFCYEMMIKFMRSEFSALSLEFLTMNQIYADLVPIALGIGLGIGLCGSYLTVRRHLRY